MKSENAFKEKLYHHTLPVADGLWESIETKLPPQKDRNRFPFFWFILFASALIGGSMMLGLLKQPEATPASPTQDASITLTESPTSNDISTEMKSSSSTPSTTSSTSSSTLSSISSSASAKNNTTAKTRISKQNINPGTLHYSLQEEDALLTNAAKPPQSSDPLPSSGSYQISDVSSFLPLCEVTLPMEEDLEMEIASLSPDPNCYKFGGVGGKYALSADFFAGPGFSPNSFQDTGGENSVYASARDATESGQYAWSAGARINLHLRNGLAARLGLLYEQTGDIFDYTDTLATQSTTRIDSFFASDGTFLYADTNRILVFGTLIKKIHNTYRHLDIPLLIGYELPMGRSTIMITAGPVFNLTSTVEGQILDPLLHPRPITPGEPMELKAYKTNVGVSLYLGAGALFPLTDQISALIEPRFLYRFNPVTLESYALEERRHYVGLNLGIRYHIH